MPVRCLAFRRIAQIIATFAAPIARYSPFEVPFSSFIRLYSLNGAFVAVVLSG